MTTHRGNASGFSLIELLVSLAVLALAMTAALVLYDSARRSFKVGENLSEQQQVIRIAFDVISSTVRLAGYNTHPDGAPNRPDEQIEAAFATAIVVRADFDGADPVESKQPEAALASGGAFTAVTTGNDEIIGFVLASDRSTERLDFAADVASTPRDGSVDPLSLNGVALTQDRPPYVLYRISVGPTGSLVRTPLIDNVRALRFTYYDRAGVEIPPPGGAKTEAARLARASIRRIGVEIEGLTRDPDPTWVDATDADPETRRFRKFRLVGDVTPKNLGLFGLRDELADSIPPRAPETPLLVAGHCGGLYVSWSPNPIEDEVAYYRLRYAAVGSTPAATSSVSEPPVYLDGLIHDQEYSVQLEAVDGAGNRSAPSLSAFATTANENTPLAPAGVVSTGGVTEPVEVFWAPVVANTESVPAEDPERPRIRDLAGYRIYRTATADAALGAPAAFLPATEDPRWTDPSGPACGDRYYRVVAVDVCDAESVASDPPALTPSSSGGHPPKRPFNVGAYHDPGGRIRVKWRDVLEDIFHTPTAIDRYQVHRTTVPLAQADTFSCNLFGFPTQTPLAEVVGSTTFFDQPNPAQLPSGHVWVYCVRAVDVCGQASAYGGAAARCSFPGEVRFTAPAYGSSFSGDLGLRVEIARGANPESYVEIDLNYLHRTSPYEPEIQRAMTQIYGPGPWQYVWPYNAVTSLGVHEVTAIVTYTEGGVSCEDSTSVLVVREPSP